MRLAMFRSDYQEESFVGKIFLYYLCALKMNKPYTMNRKQILCISLLAFSLCACQDDDTADILDAFGTPPALTKMTAQEFLDQENRCLKMAKAWTRLFPPIVPSM